MTVDAGAGKANGIGRGAQRLSASRSRAESHRSSRAPDSQTTSGAGKAGIARYVSAETRKGDIELGGVITEPKQESDSLSANPPAPDSPKSSETEVKVPEINGGKFRSADHPFFDFGGYIYPGKANPTTTTTTESRVCVVSLVSMLLLLLLNYWLGPKLLNGVEADGTS